MTPLLEAENLGHTYPELPPIFEGLNLRIGPGLNWVRGGDGRGKTTLLRLLSGRLAPTAGVIRRAEGEIFYEDLRDAAIDAVVARDWLVSQSKRCPAWQSARVVALNEAFGLQPHIDKPLYMLSTGSRRKLGLVAAAASGAVLTLLDQPFAALDPPSCRVVTRLLNEAATDMQRAWVVADHSLPDGLETSALAALFDLGD